MLCFLLILQAVTPAIQSHAAELDKDIMTQGDLSGTYAVNITVPETVDKPYVICNMELKATEGSLKGKTLTCSIPQGFYIRKVIQDGTSKSYPEERSVFKMPINDCVSETSVRIKIIFGYKVNHEGPIPEMVENEVEQSFELSASLLDETSILCTSNTASSMMKINYISSDGEVQTSNNSLVKWNMELNGYYEDDSYIIACIDSASQSISNSSQCSVRNCAGKEAQFSLQEVIPETAKSPSELTKADCEDLAESGFVFYTDSTNHCQVVILPISALYSKLNSDVNNLTSLSIDYYTERIVGSKNPAATQKLENKTWTISTNADATSEIKTEANTGKVVSGLLTLSAGEYNETTQEQVWKCEVNQYAFALDGVQVIDNFDSEHKYKWLREANAQVIKVSHYRRDTTVTESVQFRENTDTSFDEGEFEVSENEDGTLRSLKLNFGDITEDDYYQFYVKVKLVDGTFFNAQKSTYSSNSVTFTYTDMPNTEDNSVVVTKEISDNNHILIEAATQSLTGVTGTEMGKYDYVNRSLAWKMTVNPHCLPMECDNIDMWIPIDSLGAHLSKVTRIYQDGTSILVDEDSLARESDQISITMEDGLVINWMMDGDNVNVK